MNSRQILNCFEEKEIEKQIEANNFIFPSNFLWGASISSHQVEGNNHNDWSEWEKSKKRINFLERKGFLKKYGLENFISFKSTDHYNRFQEDFKIAKELKHNSLRFSIEWSRIEPEEGKFNIKEIEHYKEVLSTLREFQLEPFVTLWHFSNPIWFSKKGGWKNNRSVFYFGRYVEKIMEELGNFSRFWITINEPEIYSILSYLIGKWPPQRKNPFVCWAVLQNLINGHKKAYKIIKEFNSNLNVGIAKNNAYYETFNNKIAKFLIKKPLDYFGNFYVLEKIKNYQDFIGLNYYFHNKILFKFTKNKKDTFSDVGWRLSPEKIYFVLKDLEKYGKPIYITENGLADSKDEKRPWFIFESIKSISKAIKEGVDVRGYFHWALLDNFEWDKGFWPRFGLIEINYETLERKIRNSAYIYKKIIEKTKGDIN